MSKFKFKVGDVVCFSTEKDKFYTILEVDEHTSMGWPYRARDLQHNIIVWLGTNLAPGKIEDLITRRCAILSKRLGFE